MGLIGKSRMKTKALYQLSIAYKGMRENPKNRQGEGTTLLESGCPSTHCHRIEKENL
jgi:hypothetical protein